MRMIFSAVALMVALAGPAAAQDAPPTFAVPPAIVSSLPIELAVPEVFHTEIVAADGRIRLGFVDLSIGARGWPLTIARHYRAGAPDIGLGPDWAATFAIAVDRDPATGTLFFYEDDGGRSAYAPAGTGAYRTIAGRVDTRLSKPAGGGLERLYADGSRELFDADLHLVRREGASGSGYDVVLAEDGRPVALRHDDGQTVELGWSDGRVNEVRDMTGRSVRFAYRGGRLASRIDLLGRGTDYTYGDNGALSGVTFADGSTLVVDYDGDGRVARLAGPGMLETRFSHWGAPEDGRIVQTRIDGEGQRFRTEIQRDPVMADHYTVIETGPDGVRTVLDHRDGQVDTSVNDAWVGGVLLDASGDPTLLVTADGTVPLPRDGDAMARFSEPDERGHPRLVVHPEGAFWQKTDAIGRVTAIAGGSGQVERFEYDAGDRLVGHIDAAGVTTRYEYDSADRPVAWRADDGRFREYAYTPEGLVAEARGDGMSPVRYGYDRAGRLVSLSTGEVTLKAVLGPDGALAALVDEAGRGIRFERDAAGRITEIDDDLGVSAEFVAATEVLVEDEVGRLRGVVTDAEGRRALIGPGGALSYAEALEGGDLLVTMLLPDGQGQVERFDAAGGLVTAEALSDSPFVIETDEIGRIALVGDPLMPSTVAYGDDGLVSEVTDAIGVPTRYRHDAAGRLVSVASPYLAVELVYEGDGKAPIAIRTSEGETLSQEVADDGRTLRYSSVDRTGIRREETVELDALGRIVRQASDGTVREFEYPDDTTTILTVIEGPRRLTWREVRNPETNSLTLTRPDGTTAVTRFDAAGRVVSVRAPEAQVDYELDAEGQVLAVTTDGHRTEMKEGHHAWRSVEERPADADADGAIRVATIVDPRGNRWEAGYGPDGRAVWSTDPLGRTTRVEREATGQITRVTDPDGRTHFAIYDDLGRATEVGVVGGWSTAFGWEAREPTGQARSGGARIWIEPADDWKSFRAMVDGRVEATFRYDAQGRIASAENGVGEISHDYDDAGDLRSVADALGRRLSFERDATGRLSALVLPEGDRIAFDYVGGNAVRQTGPDGETIETTYDPAAARFEIAAGGATAHLSVAAGDVLGSVEARGADGSEGSLAVARAPDNAVAALTVNGETTTVERDALGRLAAVRGPGAVQAWTYDGSGNVTGAPDGETRSHNAAWQLTQHGAATLEYDQDGRLTRYDDTTYAYDAFGRLIRVRRHGVETLYDYDAVGNLVRRRQGTAVEEYLWFAGELLAVYDGAGDRVAVMERSPIVPNLVRVHTGDGARLLLPDQIGTPLFEIAGGQVRTLPRYGTWGETPAEPETFARWIGYAGGLSDPALGIVHLGARVYHPGLQRFGSPDPLGIDNPVNPYAYAALDPLTYTDRDGHNAQAYNPIGDFDSLGFDPRLGPATPWRSLHDHVVQNLEDTLLHETRPHIRRSVNDALQVIRQNGVRIDVHPTIRGYGDYGGDQIRVNPASSTARDPRFRGGPPGTYSPRAVGAVIGHEGRHHAQALHERGHNRRIGRLMKEFDAHLQGSNIERAVGGFHPAGSERRLMQEAMDYAFRTEYRSYLPPGAAGGLSNTFAGTGQPAFNGLRQMSPDQVARIAQTHMPEVPRHQVLDDWARTAERWRANPAAEAALRAQGPAAVATRDRMIHEARAAASRARTAAITPPRPLPQLPATPGAAATAARPAGAPPRVPPVAASGQRPTIAPPRAAAAPPDGPGVRPLANAARPPQPSATSPQPGRRITQRLPAAELPDGPRAAPPAARTTPGARTTQRLPAAELPDGGRSAGVGPRPSGGALAASRPTVSRPGTATSPPGRRVTLVPPESRPRPPATATPPVRNPRPLADPGRPPRVTGDVPSRPPVRLTPPPSRSAAIPRPAAPRAMPVRPAVSPAPRRPPSAPRPSAQGGRYQIPDLDGGGRVAPPPRSVPGARSAPPPRTPRGARYSAPHGPSASAVAGKVFSVIGVAADIYNTHRYLNGEIGHAEYLTSMGTSVLGIVLPYPLNAALAAHSAGGAIGAYLANALLESARNGDKAAQAFLDWLRRTGFINANDPTFVAVGESGPPLPRGGGMILTAAVPQWVAFSVWSEEATGAGLILSDAQGERVLDLGRVMLVPGSNHQLAAPGTFDALAPGDYMITAQTDLGKSLPGLALRVVEPVADEPESPSSFAVDVSVAETRLQPTDLPWERFDRPEPLLDRADEEGASYGGGWQWLQDAGAPGGLAHVAGGGGPPVHSVLFEKPTRAFAGENIVQYLFLNPDAPPDQIVLQVYDETLSGAHRVSFGADVLEFEDRGGFGHVAGGPMPKAGLWLRLRVPVVEIGMDGRGIAGLAFHVAGGRALFGPTRLSGGEDTSPRLVEAAGRDWSGAPEADLIVSLDLPGQGRLDLSLELREGAAVPLFSGPVAAGARHFWWQGDAGLARTARVVGTFEPDGGEPIAIDAAVRGNPALVARILYPPEGSVVRQTVPVFGQAGGGDFSEYVVDFRRVGGGDSWLELYRSSTPTIMTDAEIRRRIDTILRNELRATVYGNLASLETGSALHHFEFADSSAVMESGWIEIRLRSFDGAGNRAEDGTVVRVGEVATGQDKSLFVSPDGRAALTVPPLVLSVGMGTFSVDLADPALPAGAPAPSGAVYGFAPSGLAFRAPVTLSLEGPEGTSIAVLDGDGAVTVLPTRRDGDRITARVPPSLRPERFYAALTPPVAASPDVKVTPAPWFDGAPAPGLIAAAVEPTGPAVTFAEPISLDRPLGLVARVRYDDPGPLALILRFDDDIRLVPLGSAIPFSRRELASPPLDLPRDGGAHSLFLSLGDHLPPDARQLEGVELVTVASAAWRTFAAETPRSGAVALETLAIGTVPASADGWILADGDLLRPDAEGWHEARAKDGTTWPILVDRTPPAVVSVDPGEGALSPDLRLRVAVDERGAGLAPGLTRLAVNGVLVPAGLIAHDPAASLLTVSLGEVPGLAIPNGGAVEAQIILSDQLGQMSAPKTLRWRYRAETVSTGGLAQLTTEGGRSPAWLPDGSGFLFVAERDGQSDIARFDLPTGLTAWQTDTPGDETAPFVAPDGGFGFLTADGLELRLPDGATKRVSGTFHGLGWHKGRWVATSGNRLVDVAAPETALCAGAAGATLEAPRSLGDSILLIQSIYHRTIWVCGPETNSMTPVSADPNAPSTRDSGAEPAGPDAYLYAKSDGAGGVWRRGIGTRRESLVLENAGGLDSAFAVAPNGSALLVESGRSGRQEIWMMPFVKDVGFSLDIDRVGVADDRRLAGILTGEVGEPSWRLVDAGGSPAGVAFTAMIEPGRFMLEAAEPLPEGRWQLELITTEGVRARRELLIDRTPPALTLRRVADGAEGEAIGAVAPADRFEILVRDDTLAQILDAATGTAFLPGERISPSQAGTPPRRLIAADAVGNRRELLLDVSVGENAGARLVDAAIAATEDIADRNGAESDDRAVDGEGRDGADVWRWLLLALAIAAAGGLAFERRRRA